MLANPIVEELILAGRTLPASVAVFQMRMRKEERQNIYRHIRGGKPYRFGCIRICPPLKNVAERFRAFVTWLPTGE